MAAEGMQFPWRWNGGTIFLNLGGIWEMSVQIGSRVWRVAIAVSTIMVLVFTFAASTPALVIHKPGEPWGPDGDLCSDILLANPSATDGVYNIDPDGDGGSAPFDVWCDMTTDGGGWTVVFQSSDPSIWRTDNGTPGTGEWSHNFYVKRFPMDEVLLHDLKGHRFQIVTGIPSEKLYGCTEGDNGMWWNGNLMNGDSAFHLGVHTSEQKKQPNGYVIVSRLTSAPGCLHDLRGWGFGHLAFNDNQQGWGWDSLNLGPTVFAIGVR